MTKNSVLLTVFFILILVSLSFLTACQNANAVQPLAVVPAVEASGASAGFDFEQASENTAFRWNAMAKAYERHGLLNNQIDPDDIMAFRWNAMAKAYERHGLLNYKSNPDAVLTYRWQAMAKFYEENDLLSELNDLSNDSVAYRWLALARFYEQNGMLTRDSAPSELLTRTLAAQGQ